MYLIYIHIFIIFLLYLGIYINIILETIGNCFCICIVYNTATVKLVTFCVCNSMDEVFI